MTAPKHLVFLFKRFQSMDKRILFLLLCLLEIAVFSLDLVTGPLIPFGSYYLLPIAMATWCFDTRIAILFVIISASARHYAVSSIFPADSALYFFGDIATVLLIYSTVVFLLTRLKQSYHFLEQHAEVLEGEVRRAAARERLESSIRRAVSTDVNAIIELAALGAESGDLSKEVTTIVRQQALHTSFSDSIQGGTGSRPTWTGQQAIVPIEFWVADINGKLAGFFMIMGLDHKQGSERELHAIAVAKDYRGLGVGTAMVNFFCSHYYGRRLYAACMPESNVRHMLKRRGFYHFADTKEGWVIVERVEWPKEKGLLK